MSLHRKGPGMKLTSASRSSPNRRVARTLLCGICVLPTYFISPPLRRIADLQRQKAAPARDAAQVLTCGFGRLLGPCARQQSGTYSGQLAMP